MAIRFFLGINIYKKERPQHCAQEPVSKLTITTATGRKDSRDSTADPKMVTTTNYKANCPGPRSPLHLRVSAETARTRSKPEAGAQACPTVTALTTSV